jgi:phosphoglycolate phosphatase
VSLVRLAVFDLDGTLVDSLDDLHASVNHALAVVGLPGRSRPEVRGFVGEGARVLLAKAVAPRDELLEPALAAWRAHYEAHCLDHTLPFPGIGPLLAGAGRILAVHTNKPGLMARKILDGLGLLQRFAVVVGGDEAPRKPDPTGLLGIMAKVGVRPAETVFVGDSRHDVETARRAGVAVVAVTWGLGDRADLVAAGATSFASTAAELAPYVA